MSAHPEEVVYEMVHTLGKLPEPWNHLCFDEEGKVEREVDSEEEFEGWIKGMNPCSIR